MFFNYSELTDDSESIDDSESSEYLDVNKEKKIDHNYLFYVSFKRLFYIFSFKNDLTVAINHVVLILIKKVSNYEVVFFS